MFLPNAPETENTNCTQFTGTIFSVDYANARAVVDLGETQTPPLPWHERTGVLKTWFPPAVGQQVEVFAPNGDFANAFIGFGAYDDENPPIGNDENPVIKCGAVIIKINKQSGLVEITAPETDISGNIKITGNVDITGKLTATDDVIGGGKSLKSHKHTGVAAGASVSGVPQ